LGIIQLTVIFFRLGALYLVNHSALEAQSNITGPGKAFRCGISFFDLTKLIPDEATAIKWFESIFWAYGRKCKDAIPTKPITAMGCGIAVDTASAISSL